MLGDFSLNYPMGSQSLWEVCKDRRTTKGGKFEIHTLDNKLARKSVIPLQ